MSASTDTLDVQALARLHVDLGCDTRALRRFVDDFVALWPTRKARLVAAVDAHDTDEVTVVLLSIGSTSTMAGAAALAESCDELLREAESLSGTKLVRLAATGDMCCRELRGYVEERYAAAS